MANRPSVKFADDVVDGGGAGRPSVSGRGANARRSTVTASRLEMMQSGVPDDYIDALLDEDYMERLIVANDHLNNKRRLRLQRYLLMNKIIFGFLVAQAVLGVVVAFYKTVLQADFVFSANADLQNVDLMIMVDTSKHNRPAMDVQQQVVMNFTGELNRSMELFRQDVQIRMQENLTKTQERSEGFLVRWIPALKYLSSGSAGAEVGLHGGWLRLATGIFNAKESTTLHGFTRDMNVQKARLAEVGPDRYKSSGQWMNAFKECQKMVSDGGHPQSRKYCVIIGDNEAMCRKHVSETVLDWSKDPALAHLFPPDIEETGNMIEYKEEVQQCADFVKTNLTEKQGTEVIMMFTVKSKSDEQARLANSAFRDFVKDTTSCDIYQSTDETGKAVFTPDKDCLKFIMALDLAALAVKSKAVADLLKAEGGINPEENAFKDYRYLFFLILPLNLVFFIIWSKILRLWSRVQTKKDKMMGKKKKMIKVTKTLMEKQRHDETVEMFEANLTEVELAEVSSLRPCVECGHAMTLRARLKGGYLRKNGNKPDGGGRAFDDVSNFTFEPVEGSIKGAGLQGQRVKIKNGSGQYMKIDANGATFASKKVASDDEIPGGEDGDGDEAQEFIVEQLEYQEGEEYQKTRLGDGIRIKCCATGNYMRVHKDGRCDGNGQHNETETQMNIDLGGTSITESAIVSLRAISTNAVMFGDTDGNLSAFPGGDTWKFFKLEKKEDASVEPGKEGEEEPVELGEGGLKNIGNLKVGDTITLQGMNQECLEVAKDGFNVHCGRPPKAADNGEAGEGEAAASSTPETAGMGCQEFIIERVGMGMIAKHDNTVRSGAQICLRPKTGNLSGNAVDSENYLSVDPDGVVTADGRVTTPSIGFTIEMASMQDMVSPIGEHLLKGDCEVLIAPLWNKHEVKRLEALSAPWTEDGDLSRFKGAVVVASDAGQYTVPKAKGESFEGWVAVIKDGVDIVKAAKQAKAQGATGLIIKTNEVLSMEKLARNSNEAPPDLPAVYVDEKVAEQLNERGITLKGCEFKGTNRTAALRSIGRAGVSSSCSDAASKRSQQVRAALDVHKNVGALMKEKVVEEAHAAEERAVEEANRPPKPDGDDAGGAAGFQWKVSANTHYLWSTGGGGAAKMNVNFGKKAPPSAKREKVNMATGEVDNSCDASQNHHNSSFHAASNPLNMQRKSVTVSFVDASDLKNKNILGFQDAEDEYMTEEDAGKMEQLDDESDFKIEYGFEEVEVPVGEKAEELADEEIIDEEGAVVGQFAVPASQFWMVAVAMLASTLILSIALHVLLNQPSIHDKKEEKAHPLDENLDRPDVTLAMNFMKRAVANSFEKIVRKLRGVN